MKIYVAGPLFTTAERDLNRQVAELLESLGHTVFLPQAHEVELRDKEEPLAAAIFRQDWTQVEAADLILANLDGPDPDSGTCWEVGFAYARGKRIVGYRTDFRQASDLPGTRVNLMLDASVEWLTMPGPTTIETTTAEVLQALRVRFTPAVKVVEQMPAPPATESVPVPEPAIRTSLSGMMDPGREKAPTPTARTRPDGQFADHWVLSEAERAKGFVRPVRHSYQHVGRPGPTFPLVPVTPEQAALFNDGSEDDFVMYEPYPEGFRGSALGRFWTQADINAIGKGCGGVTHMPQAIAETYAREPRYYGSTFCCGCRAYLEVGEQGEFVWDGTQERVGT